LVHFVTGEVQVTGRSQIGAGFSRPCRSRSTTFAS
jgi:hypothetical protein